MDLRAQINSSNDIFQFNDLKDYKVKEWTQRIDLSYFKNAELQTTIFPSHESQQKSHQNLTRLYSDAQAQCQFQQNKEYDASKISQNLLIDNYKITVECIKQMQNTIKSLFYQINKLRLNSADSYYARIFFNNTVERGISQFQELTQIKQNLSKSYINLCEKIVAVKKYTSTFNSRNCLKIQAPTPLRPQQIYVSKIFRV